MANRKSPERRPCLPACRLSLRLPNNRLVPWVCLVSPKAVLLARLLLPSLRQPLPWAVLVRRPWEVPKLRRRGVLLPPWLAEVRLPRRRDSARGALHKTA